MPNPIQAPPVIARHSKTRARTEWFCFFAMVAQLAAAPAPSAPGNAPPRVITGIAKHITTKIQLQRGRSRKRLPTFVPLGPM